MYYIIKFFELNKEDIKQEFEKLFNYYRFNQYEENKNNISSIKELVEKTNFPFLDYGKDKLIADLNASVSYIDEIEQHIFEEHFMNLFHFLDYLEHTENNMKMTFSPKDGRDNEDESALIQGDFSDWIWDFSNTMTDLNVLSWYKNDGNNIQGLTFNNLDKDVKLIQKHFLADIQTKDFKDLYKKYLSIRDNLYEVSPFKNTNKTKQKLKSN